VSRRKVLAHTAFLGLFALSGCSWLPFSSSSKPAQPCPAAVILRPLANTAVFAPGLAGEPRPENVAFRGLLSEVDRSCAYAGDTVRMTLDVIVIGQRGPAARGNTVDLPYFLAVTGPGEQVISKRTFAVHIIFEPDQIRAGVTDHHEFPIDLRGLKATDLTIYSGFQQSPQVVEFFKHFR
jgi:hypothetical protein